MRRNGDQWLKQLTNSASRRETEFSEPKQLRIFTGSWNVNGKSLSEDISSWIFRGMRTEADIPDIYVIGFVCARLRGRARF